ncbi:MULTISPECIES: hypothetical protein [Arsenophonus]|jgi:hypothetical protein|uniref:hypothetical protein n=1 Tax=Arsenophonus TaxID=637 RepID=UPI0015D6B871|nr:MULTISPECIES: hypothetical protein [Arsenophonus]UBX30128.1 hypothetical protein LDL57_05830 [Arsenophonus apicola]
MKNIAMLSLRVRNPIYLNKNFLFILALILSAHIYSETDNGGVIHFYGAITAHAYQNIVNDNMLETNYWHKSSEVVTREVCKNLLIKQRQKSLAKYAKTRFLWVNKTNSRACWKLAIFDFIFKLITFFINITAL